MQSLEIKWDEGALQLEAAMLKKPQVDCPVVHYFGPGIYIREVSIAAGTLAVGHHQNYEHMNILVKGKVKFFHAHEAAETLQAPFLAVMPPGRKVAYVLEDMIWQNIYATEETDVEKLEAYYLTKSPVSEGAMVAWQKQARDVDREDFLIAIAEFGFSPWVVKKIAERMDDMTAIPLTQSVQVGPSEIEGKGLHATAPFKVGDLIAPARIEGKRTIAGRFTNHAKVPNATAVRYDNGDISFVAIQDIAGNKGGRLGEEITVDYRQVLAINEELRCQA